MILLICRVIAGLLFIGGIAYFLTQMDYFEDLQPELSLNINKFKESKNDHDKEMNSSELVISQKLMERSKYRRESDELEEKVTQLKEEKSFLLPKLKKLEEKFNKVDEEAREVQEKISSIKKEVEKENTKHEPYFTRIAQLENELEQERERISLVKEELEILENNYSKVKNLYDLSRKSFVSNKELLLAGLVKPNHLFYDDLVEITVENIAPSNTGFFIKEGRGSGFREDQVFIASTMESFEDMVFRVRCKFSDVELSYFEFNESSVKSTDLQLIEGVNLFLIRTGNLIIEDDSAQLTKDL